MSRKALFAPETDAMEPCRVWLRLKLPDAELRSLQENFPHVIFIAGEDGTPKPQQFAAVFTDDPLPDELIRGMPALKWLHATRGGGKATGAGS